MKRSIFSIAVAIALAIGSSAIPAQAGSGLPAIIASENVEPNSPSNKPSNLATLTSQIEKSVVTVYCEDSSGAGSVGSGWALKVGLTDSMKRAGVQSYVITNHHVIAGCTDGNGTVSLKLSGGATASATVFAYDSNLDVAGLVTDQYLPALAWQGPKPEQGWWVGVIGSPLNDAGILTDGIVSKVDNHFAGVTSAPMDHGNSGGPVFDNQGRVLGVASMFLPGQGTEQQSSEHFAVFRGTPMLCTQIIECGSTDNVWKTGHSFGAFTFGFLPILIGIFVIAGIAALIVFLVKRRNRGSYTPAPRAYTPTIPGSLPSGNSMPPPPGGAGGNMPPPPPRKY